MTFNLKADDATGLPSMENWLNPGADWTEHHGVMAPPASSPLFYNTSETSTTTATMFGSLSKEQEGLTHPFLKLDTLELCKEENQETLLMRTGSSSMVGSSTNEEEIAEQANSVPLCPFPSAVIPGSSLLDRTPSLEEASLYMEAESPRGPLSPAALQLGKSPRTINKRHFDDSSEASWMPESQNRSRKSPKPQQKALLLQEDLQNPTAAVAYPPFVAMPNNSPPPLAIPSPPTFLPANSNVGPAILFPTPLTLPNVPSMEEIANSRPKRRNVRISKDPQSVAARHRRERISDRVRVLQHFVPGGTKMDTASMLDEAIHYVKFLQHQLQTLERLGNSYDPRFMTQGGPLMMPQVANSGRPIDLNCGVYNSTPSTSMMQATSQTMNTWPNTRSTSPFCSQGFQDSVQEQFCH